MQAFRYSSLTRTLLVGMSLAVVTGCDLTSAPPSLDGTATSPTPLDMAPTNPNAATPGAAPTAPVPNAVPNGAAPASPAQTPIVTNPAAPAAGASPTAVPPATLSVSPQPGSASPGQPGIAISPTTSQPGGGSGATGGQAGAIAQPIRCDTPGYIAEVVWQGSQPGMTLTRKPSEVLLSSAPATVKANPDASATYASAGTSTTYARVFPDGTCFVQVVGGNGAVSLEENGRTR